VSFSSNQNLIILTTDRYPKTTAAADEITDRMLTRKHISAATGRIEKIRPIRMKSGEPGGCGIPRIYEQAINSPQS